MKNKLLVIWNIFNKYIFIVLAILFIAGGLFTTCKHSKITVQTIDYKSKYDSLTIILLQKDIQLLENAKFRDSIISAKAAKNIYYDTQIKNYSNPAIISDDSITRFISKKIYSK